MANLPISGLPSAAALDGSELLAVVQAGVTDQTTVGAVATYVNTNGFWSRSGGVLTPTTITDHVAIGAAPISFFGGTPTLQVSGGTGAPLFVMESSITNGLPAFGGAIPATVSSMFVPINGDATNGGMFFIGKTGIGKNVTAAQINGFLSEPSVANGGTQTAPALQFGASISDGAGNFVNLAVNDAFLKIGDHAMFFGDDSLVLGMNTLAHRPDAWIALQNGSGTVKGFAPASGSNADIASISTPLQGLLVDNTDLNALQRYNGATWDTIATGTGFITGTGSTSQITFFTGASTVAGDGAFSYDTTTQTFGHSGQIVNPAGGTWFANNFTPSLSGGHLDTFFNVLSQIAISTTDATAMNAVKGFYSSITTDDGDTAACTLSTFAHYHAASPVVQETALIVNAYGLYVEPQTTSRVSSGWGVYQAGTADTNFFGSPIWVGLNPPTASHHQFLNVESSFGTTNGEFRSMAEITGDLVLTADAVGQIFLNSSYNTNVSGAFGMDSGSFIGTNSYNIENTATGTFACGISANSYAYNQDGAATITGGVDVVATYVNASAGSINYAGHIHIGGPVTTGSTITELNGLRIDALKTAEVGTAFSIKQLGTADINQFAGNIVHTNAAGSIGLFGATPVPQQAGGAATAGALYTATEQTMLQNVYDAVRAIGIMA